MRKVTRNLSLNMLKRRTEDTEEANEGDTKKIL
jgi:hypothetical protein